MTRLLRSLAFLGVCAIAPVAAVASTPPVIFSQAFTGTSATGFLYGTTGGSANPCLTAATVSAPGSIPACSPAVGGANGSGALRLTNNSGNQSGFVIYNSALNEFTGLQVIFNIYMYNGTGADGISFFLIDGSYSPSVAGANGGSLGYAQKSGTGCCDAPGLVGGFIGIGFDSFGNYSNPTEGRVGGPGQLAGTVAIRGAASTSYNYVTGYTSGGSYAAVPFTMTYNSSTTRPTAVQVRILLSSSNILTVDMDPTGTGSSYQNVIPPTNLSAVTGQPAFPPTFKFGWAASTGGSTDIHEINTFLSTVAPPYLTISKQQSSAFVKNTNSTYNIQVTNSNVGGPADQTITMTDTIPNNETYVSASGTGWTCNYVSASKALTCTYPGSPQVASGTALPPITLTVTPTKNQTISNTACVTTGDGYSPTGASPYTICSTSSVTVGASAPLLTLWKRITSILRSYGFSTPQTITPTPDPGSSPGLNGTASSTAIDPGDVVTYTVYFSNGGTASACGSASAGGTCTGGPDLQDLLSPSYIYQTSTQSFTCCSNPTAANSAAFTATSNYNGTGGTLLDWVMSQPVQSASSTNAVEGNVSYQVKVP